MQLKLLNALAAMSLIANVVALPWVQQGSRVESGMVHVRYLESTEDTDIDLMDAFRVRSQESSDDKDLHVTVIFRPRSPESTENSVLEWMDDFFARALESDDSDLNLMDAF